MTDEFILLHNLATDGRVEQAPFGRTTVSLEGDTITITLTPIIGAEFEAGEKKGFIISADQDRFVVDFNHPFAGQKLFLDLSLVSFTKASAFKDIHIPWIEDHDTGLETARLQEKPAVLVLYADWCQWCKKLFDETFQDPRIKLLKDEFVWVKANSDLDKGLKSFYKQAGFPMLVFLDDKGNMVKKLEGFKDADSLLFELETMLNPNGIKAPSK
nr:thioredoxin fold domain-containing protein [Desulfobacula sp.]